MDLFFTVTSDPTVQSLRELLDRLQSRTAETGWTFVAARADASTGFRIGSPARSAVLLAEEMADWFSQAGLSWAAVIAVRAPDGTRFSITPASSAELAELRRRVAQLVQQRPYGDPSETDHAEGVVTPDNVHVTDERYGGTKYHTPPGPVLDPDDDWSREDIPATDDQA
ncbi:hypothetical protein [Streptomyces guryensis]|uniref:Uncharacterized protein n=1 Tax=Streptomyces guryensis TaxID=2886947 RepID=A0A9Q3VIH6_9ACTN|nr:hypothetical protein [Streptomyces guryensis]MCD9872596.1 hypothetical protein [Streptomyces guryensis]